MLGRSFRELVTQRESDLHGASWLHARRGACPSPSARVGWSRRLTKTPAQVVPRMTQRLSGGLRSDGAFAMSVAVVLLLISLN